MQMRLAQLGALLTAPVLLTAGCAAPGFKREWKAAVAAGVPAAGIEGPWEGRWDSASSGHSGDLRCVVSGPAAPGEPWRFHYWFSWSGLQASYEAAYPVSEKGGVFSFAGESDLGLLGGVYRHEGKATRDAFEASYTSKLDQGTFRMERPVEKAAEAQEGPRRRPSGTPANNAFTRMRRYRRRRCS